MFKDFKNITFLKNSLTIDVSLDENSISEFMNKIKQVDDETKNNLGKELFELISSKKKYSKIDDEFTNKVFLI